MTGPAEGIRDGVKKAGILLLCLDGGLREDRETRTTVAFALALARPVLLVRVHQEFEPPSFTPWS